MVIYDKYDIVFQEIPDEITLAFTLKGCLNNCIGCHSPQLREFIGNEITTELMWEIAKKYKSRVTNILFLGEGNDKKRLIEIMTFFLLQDFKISLYSGSDYIDPDYIELLTYYKVGSYKKEFGGLNDKRTNQKLFRIQAEDITYKLKK